jgi:HNH endonuclease/AP2 domain
MSQAGDETTEVRGKDRVTKWLSERLAEMEAERLLGMSSLSETRPVAAMPHYVMTRRGVVRNSKRGNKVTRPSMNNRGYLLYDLRSAGTAVKSTLHKMVAEVWLPPDPSGVRDCVDHIDGDRLNNSPSNLRRVTRLENNSNLHSAKPRTAAIQSRHTGVYWDATRKRWATTWTELSPRGTKRVKHMRSTDQEELARVRSEKLAMLATARTARADSAVAIVERRDRDVVELVLENTILKVVINNC